MVSLDLDSHRVTYVDELEEMLRSKGVEMVEIAKDGPKTLELKR